MVYPEKTPCRRRSDGGSVQDTRSDRCPPSTFQYFHWLRAEPETLLPFVLQRGVRSLSQLQWSCIKSSWPVKPSSPMFLWHRCTGQESMGEPGMVSTRKLMEMLTLRTWLVERQPREPQAPDTRILWSPPTQPRVSTLYSINKRGLSGNSQDKSSRFKCVCYKLCSIHMLWMGWD